MRYAGSLLILSLFNSCSHAPIPIRDRVSHPECADEVQWTRDSSKAEIDRLKKIIAEQRKLLGYVGWEDGRK